MIGKVKLFFSQSDFDDVSTYIDYVRYVYDSLDHGKVPYILVIDSDNCLTEVIGGELIDGGSEKS